MNFYKSIFHAKINMENKTAIAKITLFIRENPANQVVYDSVNVEDFLLQDCKPGSVFSNFAP